MITVNTENKIKNSYAADVKNVFNGNPYHEKFSDNPEKTRKNINAWVSKRTNKKIKNLLPPGNILREKKNRYLYINKNMEMLLKLRI